MAVFQKDFRGITAVKKASVLSLRINFVEFFCVCFALVTAFQDLFGIKVLLYVRYLMIFAAFIFPSTRDMRKLYFFLIMLTSDFTLYWVNICFSTIYLLRYSGSIRITRPIIFAVILLVWEILHMFIYSVYPFTISFLVKETGFALVLIAILLFLQKVDIEDEFMGLFTYWINGLLSACVLFYIKYIRRFGLSKAFSFIAGLGKNSDSDILYFTFYKDPNMVSRLCGITLIILLGLFLYRRTYNLPINSKKTFITMLALLFFGMVSGAMSLYLIIAVGGIFMVIAMFRDMPAQNAFLRMVVLLILSAAAIGAVILFLPKAVERMMRDLFQSDVSSGRLDIWRDCLRVFKEHPMVALFGVGLQDYHRKMTYLFGIPEIVLHNVLFEIIAAWGIVGYFIFLPLIASLVKEARGVKITKAPWVSFVPALAMFAVFLTGNFLYGYYMNFSFLLITVVAGVYFAKARERSMDTYEN